ncbi:MAG: 4-(cytidine 5'-diphospho)-2-C-methyl-D-erythritol kinase [Hyphomicrobiales bacterium]
MTSAVTRVAKAKINLALHIVGQRSDGYHLLDSLVAFTNNGDEIRVEKADNRASDDHQLTISGPFAKGLETGPENLVLQAVRLFGDDLPALDISLTKNLPVASGIGGGSADAAATLAAVGKLLDLPDPSKEQILSLGADVPVCMNTKAVRMRGIGEEISDIPTLPQLYIVLVNPGVGVSTPAIFKALHDKNNSALSNYPAEGWLIASDIFDWLQQNRNDLESTAAKLCPEIKECLDAIAHLKGAQLHRMSGSGATCFGLFESESEAHEAATQLKTEQPNWWVMASPLC